MTYLEEQLQEEFELCAVRDREREIVSHFLGLLKVCDEPTYGHSLRVALRGVRIMRYMNLDPKPMLFEVLHDVGKLLSNPESLKKTEGFGERDMQEMRKHAIAGYKMLTALGLHFTAGIEVRHHNHQGDKSYPKRLPKSKIPFSRDSILMQEFYSRMLALVDSYDAAATRVNNKFGDKRKLTSEEVKALMLLNNADQRYLIAGLYANGIFGDEEKQERTDAQEMLYQALWKDWTGRRTPEEARRHVTLACALEPLSDKPGCTTRHSDASTHLKLEYFIAGAINIGDSFRELARRIQEREAQPEVIYDLAKKAQHESLMNRDGGRINQGTIEMLMPIVAAQAVYDSQYTLSVPEILDKATEVLKATSREDVEQLIEMKQLAFDLCGKKYENRKVPRGEKAKNVWQYYNHELKESGNLTSIAHNRELAGGFPVIRGMYDSFINSEKRDFGQKISEAYALARREHHKGVGYGLTADCIAATIYLALSTNPRGRIII